MKKYQLIHKEISVTPFTLGIVHRGFHHKLHLRYTSPLYFKNSVIVYKNIHCDWYGDHDNFRDLGFKIIENAQKDFSFKDRLLKNTIQIGNNLLAENRLLDNTDLSKFGNTRLAKSIQKIYSLGSDLCDVGMVAAAPDVAFDNFSKLLKDIIVSHIKEYGLGKHANDYFNILTNYGKNSFSLKERFNILKVSDEISQNRKLKQVFKTSNSEKIRTILLENFKKIYQKIENIKNNYRWLEFGHLGPAKDGIRYIDDIKKTLLEGGVKFKIEAIAKELSQLRKQQNLYFKELRLDASEKKLFKIAQNFSYNKSFRYDMLLYTYFVLDKLLQEVSFRLDYKLNELRFCSLEEIIKGLTNGNLPSHLQLKERQKLCVVFIKGKGVAILSGKEADDYINKHILQQTVKDDTTTIHGTVASLGRVTGIVKVVNEVKDMDKVNEGDILVAVQTTPDLVPAMKKAAAFVTDIGGITSHAAIVAREMKKPCVIGTKFASKILKDGDMVDVNANEGDVKKIS